MGKARMKERERKLERKREILSQKGKVEEKKKIRRKYEKKKTEESERVGSHVAWGNAAVGREIETQRGIHVARYKRNGQNNCGKMHARVSGRGYELWHFLEDVLNAN